MIARIFVHAPAAVLPFFDRAAAAGVHAPLSTSHSSASTSSSAAGVAANGAAFQPPQGCTPGQALCLAFMNVWMEGFDAVAQPAERKLCAMAFAAALALPLQGILGLFEVRSTVKAPRHCGDRRESVARLNIYARSCLVSFTTTLWYACAVVHIDSISNSPRKSLLPCNDVRQ